VPGLTRASTESANREGASAALAAAIADLEQKAPKAA
jgi:hypothetical protein